MHRALTINAVEISIHAPRTGSDAQGRLQAEPCVLISIHAPRTGSDAVPGLSGAPSVRFQSTLPARGATPLLKRRMSMPRISIHAPRTGSDAHNIEYDDWDTLISIHAPRTGSDGCSIGWFLTQLIFQSTLPARGATVKVSFAQPNKRISIHAPRTGSDGVRRLQAAGGDDFNPRSPHGERLRRWREKSCKM